jgi:iron complex outermembrane receptor protein
MVFFQLHKGVLSTVSLSFLLLYPVQSPAQDAETADSVILDAVTLEAMEDDGSVRGYVAQGTSTAAKSTTSILTIAQSVSVVGRAEMADRNTQTTTQVLAYSPGVFATTSSASQRFDYFSIRGFDATLAGAYLDGLRSTTQQSYVRYQPFGMERYEVLNGPASFLYGSGSPGGVVNALSKRPADIPRHEVGLQFGKFNRKQAQFDFSSPLDGKGKLRYRLVGVLREAGTQYDHVPDDTGFIAPSFTWQPTDQTKVTVLTSYSRDTFGPPRTYLPIYGTLLTNPNGKLPWNSYLDDKDLKNTNKQLNIGVQLDHEISKIWSFHAGARYTRNDLFTQTLSGTRLGSDMRSLSRTAYQFRIVGDVLSSDANLRANWGLGRIQGSSTFGVSWRHTDEDYTLNYGTAPSIDIYAPTYGNSFSAPYKYTQTRQTGDEYGAYWGNTFTLDDRWTLDLSARRDWSSIKTDNLLGAYTTSQDDHASTGRIGISYLTDFGIAPYASYTTSFQPVLGTDFYGENYKPTRGKQAEIGIKYAPTGMDALFTLAIFDLRQTNVQTTDPDNSLNTVQTGEIKSKGVELSAAANPSPEFRLVANYTYNDIKVTESSDAIALGNAPTGKPMNMASLWAHYDVQNGPLAGIGIGLGLRYVGKTWANSANTIPVPDFTLVDLSLSYDLTALWPDLAGTIIGLSATNLFDKHYYSGCSTTTCTAGYDRNVILSLNRRW